MFLGYERNTGYYRVYDPVDRKKEATKSLGETPGEKDKLFSVGWGAEPKPNPESTTNPHTSTETTELGPSPESNNLIDDPPAQGLVAGGVVHEVITTGIPNVTNTPSQSPGSSDSEDSGPGYENLPTLERPSPRPRASSEPNNRRKDEGESTRKAIGKRGRKTKVRVILAEKQIIKYAYAEHMAAVPHSLPTSAASPAAVPHALPTSAASPASIISAPAIDSNITSEFEFAEGERDRIESEKSKHGRPIAQASLRGSPPPATNAANCTDPEVDRARTLVRIPEVDRALARARESYQKHSLLSLVNSHAKHSRQD
eukprot:g67744.t1